MESNLPLEDDFIVLSVMSGGGFLFQCPRRGFFKLPKKNTNQIGYDFPCMYASNIYEDILLKMSLKAPPIILLTRQWE